MGWGSDSENGGKECMVVVRDLLFILCSWPCVWCPRAVRLLAVGAMMTYTSVEIKTKGKKHKKYLVCYLLSFSVAAPIFGLGQNVTFDMRK